MAFGKHLDNDNDDYVAKLLAKDARDSSIRYSAVGLQALLPTRPTNNAPKPNTRFLKNIIRETDSHNAALKKKEELEAKMRWRNVQGRGGSSSKNSERRIDADGRERERKRRRVGDDRDPDEQDRQRKRRSYRSREASSDRSRSRDRGSTRVGRDDRGGRHQKKHVHISSRSHQRDRSADLELPRGRDRGQSASEGSDGHEDHRMRRKRSYTPRMNDSERRYYEKTRTRRRHRRRDSSSTSRSRHSISPRRNSRRDIAASKPSHKISETPTPSSDSDPLEPLVGPLPQTTKSIPKTDPPPTISRGRGAFKPSSTAMDAHFSTTYNPSLDLHPDSEHDEDKEDWDLALEALRDRELWKQKGAERLRAAGFREEDVKKWEDSGRERGAEDVKWTAKGQAREWDIGKVVESEGKKKGEVFLEAAWKRKGGGFSRDLKKALG